MQQELASRSPEEGSPRQRKSVPLPGVHLLRSAGPPSAPPSSLSCHSNAVKCLRSGSVYQVRDLTDATLGSTLWITPPTLRNAGPIVDLYVFLQDIHHDYLFFSWVIKTSSNLGQMRKLMHREVNQCAQGHTASGWQSQG